MKTKILLISMFLSSLTYTFAQLPTGQEEKNNYMWSIAAAINSTEAQMDQKLFDTWVFPSANYYSYFGDKHDKSLSLSVIPKYKITNDITLRFEFGITDIYLVSHYNGSADTFSQNQGQIHQTGTIGSSSPITKIDTIRQNIYRYALGVQWNFMKRKFVESYCGASLYYLHYSEMHWSDYINDNTTLLPAYNYSHYTASTPGGFATGIGFFAGANIYLHKRISVGGEFSYSLLYYKLGGLENGIYERHCSVWGANYIYSQWSIHNNASKGIQFSKVMPTFNISFWF